ncbi:arsenate reductase/protein-tyrosine-phosphatase family protein [Nocardioides pacificus]
MISILFVCTANICRSPFMELYARHALGADSQVKVSSAGTHGFVDHPMDDVMAAELSTRQIAYEAFRSRRLTGALIREADLVLTAEQSHRTFILDDHVAAFRKVLTLGQFAETIAKLDPALKGRALLDEAGRHRGPADVSLDVQDPYRRGQEAAAASAVLLTGLLETVLPRLTEATER